MGARAPMPGRWVTNNRETPRPTPLGSLPRLRATPKSTVCFEACLAEAVLWGGWACGLVGASHPADVSESHLRRSRQGGLLGSPESWAGSGPWGRGRSFSSKLEQEGVLGKGIEGWWPQGINLHPDDRLQDQNRRLDRDRYYAQSNQFRLRCGDLDLYAPKPSNSKEFSRSTVAGSPQQRRLRRGLLVTC